jgi:hypothetical protein
MVFGQQAVTYRKGDKKRSRSLAHTKDIQRYRCAERIGIRGPHFLRHFSRSTSDRMGCAKTSAVLCQIMFVFDTYFESRVNKFLMADAPTAMRKNLTKLLDIQQKVDVLSNTIAAAMSSLAISESTNGRALAALAQIESHQAGLMSTCETLYTSLKIPGDFENGQGIGREYLQTLLLARDLKVNIRQRAIASFFELDKLNQAIGGKQNPIGLCSRFA